MQGGWRWLLHVVVLWVVGVLREMWGRRHVLEVGVRRGLPLLHRRV